MKPELDSNNNSEALDDGGLYEKYKKMKPLFASNEEALAAHTKEIQALADQAGKTVEQLIIDADHGEWNDHNRQVLRLSRWISALSR